MSDKKKRRSKSKAKQHASTLVGRLTKLKAQVVRGGYNDDELQELCAILWSLRNDFSYSDKQISDVIGLSPAAISSTYSGRNNPKYQNFMRLIAGALQLCEAEVSKSVSGKSSPVEWQREKWTADWASIQRGEVQEKISTIAECLECLVLLIRQPNDVAPLSKVGLTEIQKSELVAMLETALAMLKSPMVELGFLRRLGQYLGLTASSAAKKGIEDAVSHLATDGADMLESFIDSVS